MDNPEREGEPFDLLVLDIDQSLSVSISEVRCVRRSKMYVRLTHGIGDLQKSFEVRIPTIWRPDLCLTLSGKTQVDRQETSFSTLS
jgi:hypothetical protein